MFEVVAAEIVALSSWICDSKDAIVSLRFFLQPSQNGLPDELLQCFFERILGGMSQIYPRCGFEIIMMRKSVLSSSLRTSRSLRAAMTVGSPNWNWKDFFWVSLGSSSSSSPYPVAGVV